MKKNNIFLLTLILIVLVFSSAICTATAIRSSNHKERIAIPNAPLIEGPINCIIGNTYDYGFTYLHPYGYDIYYRIYWGDCMAVFGDGPHKSGEKVVLPHTWCKICCTPGITTIFVFAFDDFGYQSDMSCYQVNLRHGRTFVIINHPTICWTISLTTLSSPSFNPLVNGLNTWTFRCKYLWNIYCVDRNLSKPKFKYP